MQGDQTGGAEIKGARWGYTRGYESLNGVIGLSVSAYKGLIWRQQRTVIEGVLCIPNYQAFTLHISDILNVNFLYIFFFVKNTYIRFELTRLSAA